MNLVVTGALIGRLSRSWRQFDEGFLALNCEFVKRFLFNGEVNHIGIIDRLLVDDAQYFLSGEVPRSANHDLKK